MKNIMWRKLKSHFTRADGSRKDRNKLSVNEEYLEAFRTKSYMEIHSKVQGQLRGTSSEIDNKLSSSSSLPSYMHLSDYLIEPRQETLAGMIESFRLHHLLIDYFEASLEAYKICEMLLLSIHQTRANYQIIKKVIKLTRRLHHPADYTTEQCGTIFGELAKFSRLTNPLLPIGPAQFHDIHQSHKALLPKLISKSKKSRRKARLQRLCRRVAGLSLIISYSAVTAALLVLAIHSMVGIVAATGLMGCFVGPFRSRLKLRRKGDGTGLLERLGAQLEAAAKGVYILINDFDTMSRLVSRLHDEVEHIKVVVDMCVRNGRRELLMEVVKEFHVHESFFLEQLEELEGHIYLCLLTINRSRMLVIRKIMDSQKFTKK